MVGAVQNPGRFRHRVELQARTDTPDGLGGQETGWRTLAPLWACVMPVRQSEGISADHLQGTLSHEVHLRYRNDITSGMRFLHRSRSLRIVSCIDAREERRFLICLCEEEK